MTQQNRRKFYKHVGWVMGCPVISGWPDRSEMKLSKLDRACRRLKGLEDPRLVEAYENIGNSAARHQEAAH